MLIAVMALMAVMLCLQPFLIRKAQQRQMDELRAEIQRLERERMEFKQKAETLEADFGKVLTHVQLLLGRVL